MTLALKRSEVWFVAGSQHLYGPETLRQVAAHSEEIARAQDVAPAVPVRVVFQSVLKTSDEVFALCQAANQSPNLERGGIRFARQFGA